MVQRRHHFLQVPGPTNVPERVLRAIDHPIIDHRGPMFQRLGQEVLEDLKPIFKTRQPVIVYPASDIGTWEAALVNSLSPGDQLHAFETGHFATLWRNMAQNIGLRVDFVSGGWRHGIDLQAVEDRLTADRTNTIRAVMAVHNETSTGVTSRIAAIRKALDQTHHPALLMIDTISSLASIDYRHDECGVDVTVAGSQKGLMRPSGLSFNAVSDRALAAAASHAEATRRAVPALGLEVLCANPAEYSSSLTAVMLPEGHDEAAVRRVAFEHFNLSLGQGLGKLKGRVFRIGHLGDFNDLMLCGTLAGVEMGLELAGVPHRKGGVSAAMAHLVSASTSANDRAAQMASPCHACTDSHDAPN